MGWSGGAVYIMHNPWGTREKWPASPLGCR